MSELYFPVFFIKIMTITQRTGAKCHAPGNGRFHSKKANLGTFYDDPLQFKFSNKNLTINNVGAWPIDF